MTKFIQFVSKILTKQEIINTTAKISPLKIESLEAKAANDSEKIDAIDYKLGGYMLRQTNPKQGRYLKKSLESKIS